MGSTVKIPRTSSRARMREENPNVTFPPSRQRRAHRLMPKLRSPKARGIRDHEAVNYLNYTDLNKKKSYKPYDAASS